MSDLLTVTFNRLDRKLQPKASTPVHFLCRTDSFYAGALFGAAWWVLADAIVYSKAILDANIPWTYLIPGVAGTLALVFMNLVSREELNEISDESSLEEGAAVS